MLTREINAHIGEGMIKYFSIFSRMQVSGGAVVNQVPAEKANAQSDYTLS